jgi:hypothetical protein
MDTPGTPNRTESIRVRLTRAEKASLQHLANLHTNGNVGELLRSRALGTADVAAGDSRQVALGSRPAAAPGPSPRQAPRVGRAARSGGFDGPGNPD